ncbi:hypothetical protein [Natronomonas salsuginis]|uniref:Uncharacterized protein n=1 Tax=Natronomonas salsuginis TaxID=2217661 RepID=A0A4U5JAS1_9EURY|nr:hypothetical protein [Natronomonas salsuginis]TKR24908.1 hypothetical protein DM868_13335 [Natronomonas salsuginis]
MAVPTAKGTDADRGGARSAAGLEDRESRLRALAQGMSSAASRPQGASEQRNRLGRRWGGPLDRAVEYTRPYIKKRCATVYTQHPER